MRKQDKVKVALKKLRDERMAKLHKEIVESYSIKDFDLMLDQVQQIIIKTKLKLSHHELQAFTDLFYKKEKPTRERLDLADKFFVELDHANNQILNGKNSVGLFYV